MDINDITPEEIKDLGIEAEEVQGICICCYSKLV
mgnify:CR=1 FL=1